MFCGEPLGRSDGAVLALLVVRPGRIGGEEFAIFLPGADPSQSWLVAEGIRRRIREVEFAPGGRPCPLSVSIGGVAFSGPTTYADMVPDGRPAPLQGQVQRPRPGQFRDDRAAQPARRRPGNVSLRAERGWDHGLYFAAPITGEFLPGLLIGYVARRRPLPFPRACIVLGCIIVAVAGYYAGPMLGTTTGLLRLAIDGTAASLIVWGVLSLEGAGWHPARWLTFLGDISYSTYMWLWPTMIAVSLLFGAWLSHSAGVVSYIITTGICVLMVSWASYRWIERPSTRWAGGLFKRPARSGPMAASSPVAVVPLPAPALSDGLAVRQT